MSARFCWNVSAWVGIMSGIYVLLYQLTPMAALGVLPCTFIALPIYLTGGAKKENFLDACLSAMAGVGWAVLFLTLGAKFVQLGMQLLWANSLSVLVCTTALCAAHMLLSYKGLFTNIPMMFGAIASTFLIGSDKWPYIMLTLCLGVLLGFVNNSGGRFLDSTGRWVFLARIRK